MKNQDKPINPLYAANHTLYLSDGLDEKYLKARNPLTGLTKREYFASMAMQGIISNNKYLKFDYVGIAQHAVTFADVLLKELDK